VSWFSSWATSFSANVITNTWLGFPFMMVVALGALETIPKEIYEAADVDGASPWQRFRHITLPHLRPALGPAVALGSIWTFNMFNVIYLVSAGAPGGSTNILVTDAYRWAFERGERYGMAAAYATIIFGILLLWTVFGAPDRRPRMTSHEVAASSPRAPDPDLRGADRARRGRAVPVLLVCKKAFEPGRQFALSASPIPTENHARTLR